MEALGHVRFRLAGHDRGGRVAYRLALDHPGRLEKLACSTSCRPGRCGTTWMRGSPSAPGTGCSWRCRRRFPETLIGKDPLYYFDTRAARRHQDQEPLRLRSARARALPRLLQRSGAHPRHLRGLSRRPHHRSRARRSRPRGRQEDHLSDAGALGRGRRHPGRDRRSARDLAGMGDRRARFRHRQRALSRRRKRRRRPPRR